MLREFIFTKAGAKRYHLPPLLAGSFELSVRVERIAEYQVVLSVFVTCDTNAVLISFHSLLISLHFGVTPTER